MCQHWRRANAIMAEDPSQFETTRQRTTLLEPASAGELAGGLCDVEAQQTRNGDPLSMDAAKLSHELVEVQF